MDSKTQKTQKAQKSKVKELVNTNENIEEVNFKSDGEQVIEKTNSVAPSLNDMEFFKAFFEFNGKNNEEILEINRKIHVKKRELKELEDELFTKNNASFENDMKMNSIIEKYKDIYERENQCEVKQFKGFSEDGGLMFE